MPHKNPQFLLRIPPKLRARLESLSAHEEKTKTAIILEALALYLELKEGKLQDTTKAESEVEQPDAPFENY